MISDSTRKLFIPLILLSGMLSTFSCSGEEEHMAEAINNADSLPAMHAVGVNSLISDSGLIRYHLVCEEWDIHTIPDEQPTWRFWKGLFMERFDEKFHIDLYVQADTAYLHKQSMWELRGRVRVRNVEGTVFLTEELYWDMDAHEMWNHCHMHIITPERELQGTEFRSNEEMTRYSVANSNGEFPFQDTPATPESEPQDTSLQDDTPKLIPSAPHKYDNLKK